MKVAGGLVSIFIRLHRSQRVTLTTPTRIWLMLFPFLFDFIEAKGLIPKFGEMYRVEFPFLFDFIEAKDLVLLQSRHKGSKRFHFYSTS